MPRLVESIRDNYTTMFQSHTKIGVITIKDGIFDSSPHMQQLHSYFANDQIKAILLKIDSPGGAAGTGFALYDEIKALKKEFPKPIITLVENMCTSSAYLIATATDHIITSSLATIANIELYTSFTNFNKLLTHSNIEYNNISAGAYKTIGDPLSPISEEQKTSLQQLQNDAYQQFIKIVAKERKLSLVDVSLWGNGKIFTGKQAIEIGLADSIGSLHHAKQILKQKAFIESDIRWVNSPAESGFFSHITESAKKQFSIFSSSLLQFILSSQEYLPLF